MTKETILIYGLAGKREAYAESLGYFVGSLGEAIDLAVEKKGYSKQVIEEAEKQYIPIFIDDYNNEIRNILGKEHTRLKAKANSFWYKEAFPNEEVKDSIWCSEEFFSKFSKEWINYVDEGKKHWPLWENYFRGTQMNQKNELKTIYQEVFNKNKDIYFHNWHVKRGCKIGLDIAMEKQDMKIYYCLDGINIKLVLNENDRDDDDGRKSYTSIELRYIYRNWEKLRGKVIFISQGEKVKAPWEQEPEVWQAYQPKSWQKLLFPEKQETSIKQTMNTEKRSLVDAITMGIETTRKLHEELVTAKQRGETHIEIK